MIVDPDFLDHWKTRMLVDLLDGDECAPLYVIRLWSHCQTRRNWVFDIPPEGIKALCRFQGSAMDLDAALITSGFLLRDGQTVTLHGWDEHNSALIANWANGKKGGRPPKSKPKQNPSKTHGEPIGEDRMGEDKNPPVVPQRDPAPSLNDIAQVFNESLGDTLPKCLKPTKARNRALKARITEDSKRRDLAWWRKYFEVVRESDFLMGRSPRGPGHEHWMPDIDWLLNESNMAKVIEGKFHRSAV